MIDEFLLGYILGAVVCGVVIAGMSLSQRRK